MCCKQPEFNVQTTMQRCKNFSSVLSIGQCNTVMYTALCYKQITTVTVIFTHLQKNTLQCIDNVTRNRRHSC